jgi:hypothetical protein
MHFPKYWNTARHKSLTAWGWSDESLADAARRDGERLARIRDWLARGGKASPGQRYGYPDGRPLREEVLREFRADDGTLRAAVTRNSYGCLVLNSADLMFVDVDAPEAKASSFLAGLFGFRKLDQERRPDEFPNQVLARVNDWVSRFPGWGWRVYRTRCGIRLMATHQPVSAADPICQTAFEVFKADPLYRKLCVSQKCFRARLTPKPWRCDLDKPRDRWPWLDEKAEARFRKWEAKYAQAAERHSTCNLLGQFGSPDFNPGLKELVALHDQATRAESALPLA